MDGIVVFRYESFEIFSCRVGEPEERVGEMCVRLVRECDETGAEVVWEVVVECECNVRVFGKESHNLLYAFRESWKEFWSIEFVEYLGNLIEGEHFVSALVEFFTGAFVVGAEGVEGE
ncbi:MAG: hypothetical protein DHS20C07_31750 [Methyloligella sp.]|nr:MAG: hypothetical protein DHS20C07_31750 [Methyloligella sp.]